MRLVLVGNHSVPYTSESHHSKSLETLGHEVIRLQQTQATGEEILNQSLKSDALIYIFTHGWVTPGMRMGEVYRRLRLAGIPTITYHLDLLMQIPSRWAFYQNHDYLNVEYFFTPDANFANWFTANKGRGYYLPAGVLEEECYIAQNISPNANDVIFVGSKRYHPSWPYRPKLIDWLKESYGDRFTHIGNDGEVGVQRGHNLNQIYASSKVVVGDSYSPNFDYAYFWSDRVYETLGRGGFLIHPLVKGMQDSFTSGKHLRFYEYDNFKQLKYFIDYYLENDDERENIRQQGHELVKEKHTYRHRWQRILEIIK